jgi:hypothetical protein
MRLIAQAIHAQLPWAQIVVDHFHLVRGANTALDVVRRQRQRQAQTDRKRRGARQAATNWRPDASLLATCAADAQVSEGEIVERSVRSMDLRALVAQIRVLSKLDEGDAMALVQEELRAARAEHAA